MLTPHACFTPAPSDLIQATFDRHHGVSISPFTSLNCSFTVGDDRGSVLENRSRIKRCLGINRIVSARQIHGDQVLCIGDMPEQDQEREGVDALMTNTRGVGLMIQHADCQAVLLHDPVQSAIAAIHCGWRGSVIQIINKTVQLMWRNYRSLAKDLRASISPSLGPCCAEFINHDTELPSAFLPFQTRSNYFDFWQISRSQLIESGIRAENISVARICTSCNPAFFSYRRANRKTKGVTGRNCTIIALKAQ
jgi:polyphenol oxidase